MRAEPALHDRDTTATKPLGHLLHEWRGCLGRGGAEEVGTTPAPGVGEERELGHEEAATAGVEERVLELPLLVFEDPEVENLVGEVPDVVGPVARRHTQQGDEPRSMLPITWRSASTDAPVTRCSRARMWSGLASVYQRRFFRRKELLLHRPASALHASLTSSDPSAALQATYAAVDPMTITATHTPSCRRPAAGGANRRGELGEEDAQACRGPPRL